MERSQLNFEDNSYEVGAWNIYVILYSLLMASASVVALITMVAFQLPRSTMQNSVYDTFEQSLKIRDKQSIPKYCASFKDCAPTECCIPSKIKQLGVCRKRPSIGDTCGPSVVGLGCPCIRGTTCTKSMEFGLYTFTRRIVFSCATISFEELEVVEW